MLIVRFFIVSLWRKSLSNLTWSWITCQKRSSKLTYLKRPHTFRTNKKIPSSFLELVQRRMTRFGEKVSHNSTSYHLFLRYIMTSKNRNIWFKNLSNLCKLLQRSCKHEKPNHFLTTNKKWIKKSTSHYFEKISHLSLILKEHRAAVKKMASLI